MKAACLIGKKKERCQVQHTIFCSEVHTLIHHCGYLIENDLIDSYIWSMTNRCWNYLERISRYGFIGGVISLGPWSFISPSALRSFPKMWLLSHSSSTRPCACHCSPHWYGQDSCGHHKDSKRWWHLIDSQNFEFISRMNNFILSIAVCILFS